MGGQSVTISECAVCPPLRVENARLRGQVRQLEARIDQLRDAYAELVGGVAATVQFLEREDSEPTMGRRQLIPAMVLRLNSLIERTEGRHAR